MKIHSNDRACIYVGYRQLIPVVSFFAFLRSGEFTLPAGVKFDPSRHLSPSDVTIDSLILPSVCIHLKSSKTDTSGAVVNYRSDPQLSLSNCGDVAVP
jgi:hypothetical protein